MWEQSLVYAYGSVSHYGFSWLEHCAIPNTNANSFNPTIIADYNDYISNPFNYHLAWEQKINTTSTKINYCKLYYLDDTVQTSAVEEVSANSGYTKNYNPLITLRKVSNMEYIYFSWIGYRKVRQAETLEKTDLVTTGETRMLVRNKYNTLWSVIGVLGNNATSQNLNTGNALYSNQQVMGLV